MRRQCRCQRKGWPWYRLASYVASGKGSLSTTRSIRQECGRIKPMRCCTIASQLVGRDPYLPQDQFDKNVDESNQADAMLHNSKPTDRNSYLRVASTRPGPGRQAGPGRTRQDRSRGRPA